MPSSGATAIRQLLAEGIEQIAQVPPEQPEAGVSAFTAFRRGVTQASSGREAPPDQLLADLQPKDATWRFLVALLRRKPMYRKQVAAVAAILLSCRPWVDVLRKDEALCKELPDELAAVLRDAEGKLDEQSEGSGDEDEEEQEGQEELVGKQRSKRESTTQRALDMLAQGQQAVEALNYSAAKTDEAIDAFEAFQRAVMWVVRSPQEEDDEALDALRHKDQILRFIIDFYMRKPTHRLRIAAIFVRLLGFGNWRAAILADPSVRGAVFDMTKDPGLAEPSPEESQPAAVGIDEAVAEAVANGGVGAVYVRVIAAYDLVSGSGADEDVSLHVNLSLGDTLRRTDSMVGSLNPRWMSAPFLLHVPSLKSVLRFEVLDSDLDKDESFGSLELPAAELPTEPGSSFSRHALYGVTRGELELEAIFRRAADVAEEAEEDGDAVAGRERGSSWLVPAGNQPSLQRKWSMKTNGRIFCPAGHEVDERKEGSKGWHIFGGPKERHCSRCNATIPADGVRWRCSFHCDFNVCERCYGGLCV